MKRSAEKTSFLADVLVTAVEGGIGYWSRAYEYRWVDDPGGSLELVDASVTLVDHLEAVERGMDLSYSWEELDNAHADPEDSRLKDITWHVTLDTIAKGFGLVMKSDGRGPVLKRLREAYRKNDAGLIDSGDADVLVQLATIGEVKYG